MAFNDGSHSGGGRGFGGGGRGGGFRGGGGGFRGGRGGGGGGGFRRNFGPREMHKITCAECGNEGEVPFKPREGSPVLCRECFAKKNGRTFQKRESSDEENSDE